MCANHVVFTRINDTCCRLFFNVFVIYSWGCFHSLVVPRAALEVLRMGARRADAAAAAASEHADVDARRARKRITDRKSQRHHGERQRAYVRELEETVKFLRQSCADVDGGDAAANLTENERLQQRCQKLEAAMATALASANNIREGYAIDMEETSWWCSMLAFASESRERETVIQIGDGAVPQVYKLSYS